MESLLIAAVITGCLFFVWALIQNFSANKKMRYIGITMEDLQKYSKVGGAENFVRRKVIAKFIGVKERVHLDTSLMQNTSLVKDIRCYFEEILLYNQGNKNPALRGFNEVYTRYLTDLSAEDKNILFNIQDYAEEFAQTMTSDSFARVIVLAQRLDEYFGRRR